MAANPRGGEGASKGSRYIPERLVGPGVIDQNSYVDIAKAHLHIGDVVPVCNVAQSVGAPMTGNVQTINFPAGHGPGSIVRVINTNAATTTNNGSIAVAFGDVNVGNALTVVSESSSYFVIPPGATDIRFTGAQTGTTIFEHMGAFNRLRVEWTLDN